MMRPLISVSITAGATALTRRPCLAYSTAAALVSPTMACLLALYSARPGTPTSPLTEAQLTTAPPPVFSSAGISAFRHRNRPRTLASKICA
jgi:hypothetical protein